MRINAQPNVPVALPTGRCFSTHWSMG